MEQNVKIFKGKEDSLGVGSYGAVYKAKYNELPCAAKILHPTLFQTNDPGARKILERFQQECRFMRGICHPNIVQFLGVCEDPSSDLPVLLMELMDESLTKFLEKSKELLSYHVQFNFCHDIAIALHYLHMSSIVHRDLSSNNVLLIADRRAKVTDFGMSKLMDASGYSTTRQSVTFCPGTEVYMPPEAMKEPPLLSEKHDCFSLGVLALQILTRLWPKPGPRKQDVPHSASPTGMMEIPVLETERRNNHIQLVDPSHPLLPIAISCLSYNVEDRPSAKELCHSLATLKETPEYKLRIQDNKRSTYTQTSTCGSEESESTSTYHDQHKYIQELQQQRDRLSGENRVLSEKVSNKERQLQQKEVELSELRQHKDRAIQTLQTECDNLRQSSESVARDLQTKERLLHSKEQQIQSLNQQARNNEYVLSEFQQTLKEKVAEIERLHSKASIQTEATYQPSPELARSVPTHMEDSSHSSRSITPQKTFHLSSEDGGKSVVRMARGSAAVCDEMVYIRSVGSKEIFSFSFTTKHWERLPSCPQNYFTLVTINGLVTAIGVGESEEQSNNVLHSYMSGSGSRNKKWMEIFPRMNTRRFNPAVVCSRDILVVAGGTLESRETLNTVEVFDVASRQWFFSNALPILLSQASAAVCGDRVYLVGGVNEKKEWTSTVLSCPLDALERFPQAASSPKRTFKLKLMSKKRAPVNPWSVVADAPFIRSTCVCFEEQILAVGGNDSTDPNEKATNAIYAYNPLSNSWDVLGNMNTARAQCLVVAVTEPCSRAIVLGGWSDTTMCDGIEILSLT